MKLIHKVMDFNVGRVDEKERTFWAVASTGGLDRQGDIIDASGWELSNFLKNPVIPWAHDYNSPPVAKALEVKVEGKSLVFKAQFPSPEEYAFADTIFKLYKGGYLRAFSVGFSPIQSEVVTVEKHGRSITGTRYLKQELYEISCVTLPANPEALVAAGIKPSAPLTPMTPLPASSRAALEKSLVSELVERLIKSRLQYHLG